MNDIFKRLLIPLCHAFILLPLLAILGGAPGTAALWGYLALLLGLGVVGWLLNELMPHRAPILVSLAVLLLLGLLGGYSFIPALFCRLSRGVPPMSWMRPVLGLGAGLVMAWSLLECRRGLANGLPPAELGIGLFLYLPPYFSYRTSGLYTAADNSDLLQPICLFGILWLFLALLIISYENVSRIATSKNQANAPRPVLFLNGLMALGVSSAILLLASIPNIRRAFMRLLQAISSVMKNLSQGLDDFLNRGGGEEAAVEEGVIEGMVAEAAPEWIHRATMVIVWILVIVIGAACLYLLYRKVRSLFRDFRTWLSDRISGWQREEAAYQEEEEQVMGWEQLRRELGNRVAHRRRSVGRLEDQPDNRAKLRWLYARLRDQMLLKKKYQSQLTPREMAQRQFSADPPVSSLLTAYSEARYSEHPVPDDAVSQGQNALRHLKL